MRQIFSRFYRSSGSLTETRSYMMKNGAPPAAWTAEIAKHIKSLAPRHLVIDGSDGVRRPLLT